MQHQREIQQYFGKVRRAFTLIEILVVLLIMSLLAAILYPVLSHARDKAYQAGCQFNLKQISLAMRMYAQDYDGRLPMRILKPQVVGTPPQVYPGFAVALSSKTYKTGWAVELLPYTQNYKLYWCPAAKYRQQDDPTSRAYNSYFYNAYLSGNWSATRPGVKIASIDYPGNTFLLGDALVMTYSTGAGIKKGAFGSAASTGVGSGNNTNNDAWNTESGWDKNGHNYWGAQRHSEGANYAFVDGHVKWLLPVNAKRVPATSSVYTFVP